MEALLHPEDGEQRRKHVKRFIYGETQEKTLNSINFKNAGIFSISNNDVNLLISGTKITAVFIAADNSTLIDEFSLIGFTKSLRYLSSNCI